MLARVENLQISHFCAGLSYLRITILRKRTFSLFQQPGYISVIQVASNSVGNDDDVVSRSQTAFSSFQYTYQEVAEICLLPAV